MQITAPRSDNRFYYQDEVFRITKEYYCHLTGKNAVDIGLRNEEMILRMAKFYIRYIKFKTLKTRFSTKLKNWLEFWKLLFKSWQEKWDDRSHMISTLRTKTGKS